MKRRLSDVSGRVLLEAIGAYPEDMLSALARENIRFRRLRRVDELTVTLEVSARDMPRVRQCAKKAMCNLEIRRVWGIVPFLEAMGWRLLYPVALLGLTLLVFWLQGHLMFFSVSGNETVPSEQILRVLEMQNVKFWTPADSLDANQLKNQVLGELPQLGWLTVNTEGPFAEVIVREREERPAIFRDAAPANLIARKSGLITKIDTERGTAQVKKGDMVRAGDLLISGVTNLERTTLLTRAEGEVYARTWTLAEAVLPQNGQRKVYTGRETARWSLTWGKNTINFFKTSGISYAGYDKIIDTRNMALPGGLVFPLKLTRTVFREYRTESQAWGPEQAETLLRSALRRQIAESLTAGMIQKAQLKLEESERGFILRGAVECREEIGSIVEIKE